MPIGDGSEPITDDEIVYRRVSEKSGWYNPIDRSIAWEAFRPNKKDTEGVSVWRAKYKSTAQVAAIQARSEGRYYVIALLAGKLRLAGVTLEPTPIYGLGHASLVNLNTEHYATRKNAVRELANLIAAELVESVEGPFGPFPAGES
jgi:hypothetical protein